MTFSVEDPTASGNRQRWCGTWSGLTWLHFNSQTSGYIGGYPVLQNAGKDVAGPSDTWQICKTRACPKISEGGRCGPLFGGAVCSTDDRSWALYCNEANGWCGNAAWHKNAQASTKYDNAMIPDSCRGTKAGTCTTDAATQVLANGQYNPDCCGKPRTFCDHCSCGRTECCTTSDPTVLPTAQPTAIPTAEPTDMPTSIPTAQPTAIPTDRPTTAMPTAFPTVSPTAMPTAFPTVSPSTVMPTAFPTVSPTVSPTPKPSAQPTMEPSAQPTVEPTTCDWLYDRVTELAKEVAELRLENRALKTRLAKYDLRAGATCAEGYKPITSSWQDCEEAARSMGFVGDPVNFVEYDYPWGTKRPQGCFRSDVNNRFHFNRGAGGDFKGNDRILCIRKGKITAETCDCDSAATKAPEGTNPGTNMNPAKGCPVYATAKDCKKKSKKNGLKCG